MQLASSARWLLAGLALTAAVSVASASFADDWGNTPEAYFLMAEERKAWKKLAEQEREAFVSSYWKRRDPTPDTELNEFRSKVLARIATANERFDVGTKPGSGSASARGQVFIVLGPPAVERQVVGPLQVTPVIVAPGRLGLPREALERTEWHVWVYDREHTPDVLSALGRPTAEVAFIVEPGRRDQLQSSALFATFQELVAKTSIVNPSP